MLIQHVLLHLSLIKDIGPATVHYIVTQLSGQLGQLPTLYDLSEQQLCLRFGLTKKRAQALVDGLADLTLLEEELHRIQKHGISWTTVCNDDYPKSLQSIYLPPLVLYWQGTHPNNYTKTIALVGSRDGNSYGKSIITRFVPDLVAGECTIISGGAFGIDTMAHQATIDAGGITCVVLGSGLLHPYPRENKPLFNAVIQTGGTVLSSFALTAVPTAHHFPQRNRIIAGLSKGCVVIQAAKKSGARITAEFALEQGKSVCAVPGPIDDPLSEGCHELIRQGALLVCNAATILHELQYELPLELIQNNKRTKSVSQESAQPNITPKTPTDIILQLCVRPTSVDDLVQATQLPIPDLHDLLFSLQLSGQLQQLFSGLWATK